MAEEISLKDLSKGKFFSLLRTPSDNNSVMPPRPRGFKISAYKSSRVPAVEIASRILPTTGSI